MNSFLDEVFAEIGYRQPKSNNKFLDMVFEEIGIRKEEEKENDAERVE